MTKMLRTFLLVSALFTAGDSIHGFAQEKSTYPSRPVRFIIPFPPGGGTDIVGRMVAERLGESLGETFVVDNRPGAASTLGSAIAARATPDGYTIIMITASYSIAASFYKNLPYHPVTDFDAIARVAAQPLVLVVNRAVQANSVAELIGLAKADPDKLNYASGGAGGINHLAAEMFNSATGTRIVHVPYKGAGPALTGLIGGETQLMFATLGSAIAHIRFGKLKALAVGSMSRSALLPNAPTLAEAGVRGYEASNWYGVLAPRGTPGNIVALLNKEVGLVLQRKDVADRLEALAFDSAFSTPAQFADYLRAEIAKWAKAMKEAGL
ncbi:MAG: hypothetical protein A3G24_12900 [Betaproteobacteria bacterium RIFCSPLOWO2_12_FULL_62_13]|nr:MAG: hypothetical protein A3G24_12900 [Betaproteobacteria bacterium RIFCSPLOWO2_12_FULL_62_13]